MMNAEKAFKLYWGMSLHFSTMKYSILTYGIDTKLSRSKFAALSQFQRFRFDWMATRFKDAQNLVYACIGCQLDGVNMQFDSKDAVLEAYFKFKGRRESLTHTLQTEVIKHELLGFVPVNKLIYKHLVGEFSPEYVLLLCHGNNDLNTLYESPNLSWAKDKILKLIKYSPFINLDKYTHLIENHENHVPA